MKDDKLVAEVTKGLADFAKNAEDAKEYLLSAFPEDPTVPRPSGCDWRSKLDGFLGEWDSEKDKLEFNFFLTMGFLVFILVTFLIYFVFSKKTKK